MSADDALNKLMDTVIQNAYQASSDTVRRDITNDQVQDVYRLYSKRLYKCYCRFSETQPIAKNVVPFISITGYKGMLEAYSLVDETFSIRKAMSAFAMSQ